MTFAAAALALHLAATPAAPEDVYAIIVGYNGGRSGGDGPTLPPLRFADDDVLRFHRWFSGLVPADHLWLLTELDETTRAKDPLPEVLPPTRTALLAAIDALKAKAKGQHARVFFVYAGHGLPGRFLLQPEGGDEAAFTGRELRTAFASVDANPAVLFLDACRSQSLFAERGATDFSADVQALERSTDAARLGILTAASSTQSAGEAASLGGGYFSHVLASGLAGAADADADGTVRFGELAAFVAFHTERLFGQRPWFEAPGGDLRAPVLELAGRPGLRLDPALLGRLRVRDIKSGALVVELNKPPGIAAQLVVPPGLYRVERNADAAEVEVVQGADKTLVELAAFTSPLVASRGAEELDGFSSPFSTDVVNALSAGYQSGTQVAQAGPWSHALDLAYGFSPAPLGLPAVANGVEGGYRYGIARFFIGLRGAFSSASFNAATLRRASGMLEGGLRFRPLSIVELEPHLGAGLGALWRESLGTTRGDFTVPQLAAGVRLEVALAYGLFAALDARVDVSFVALDGSRSPFFSPQVNLGVAWKR